MRKTVDRIIEADGRDKGKMFRLTEMSSRLAERWADRAFLALAHAGVDLPAGVARSGMSGIAQIAHLVGNIKFPELEPLLDELMACVQFVPDPKRPAFARALQDSGIEGDDIEEVDTRHYLRSEVIDLHTNFSLAATILNLIAVASTLTVIPEVSESIPTSRRRSRRSSQPA